MCRWPADDSIDEAAFSSRCASVYMRVRCRTANISEPMTPGSKQVYALPFRLACLIPDLVNRQKSSTIGRDCDLRMAFCSVVRFDACVFNSHVASRVLVHSVWLKIKDAQ